MFCCYDWLMVDDRALRFRQEYRAPVSRPLAPTPFEMFAKNYAESNRRRVDDMVKYGGETSRLGSRIADMAVGSDVVSDSPGLRAAAIAGDIVLDPAVLIPGSRIFGALQDRRAQKAAENFWKNNPETSAATDAMLSALMGRLNN